MCVSPFSLLTRLRKHVFRSLSLLFLYQHYNYTGKGFVCQSIFTIFSAFYVKFFRVFPLNFQKTAF